MIVTLQQLKDHLIIEHNADDLYLLDLLTVAEDAVMKRLNIAEWGENPHPTIIQSILIVASNLYNNRESNAYTNVNKIPHTLDFLFSLDKNYDDNIGRK